jgi:hypothetical protein
MLKRVLRWWLPWILTMLVSSALAYAAEAGLEHAAAQPPAPPIARVAAPPGVWIRITSTSAEGKRSTVRCRVQPGLTDVDELSVEPRQLDELVRSMCLELWLD